MSDIIYRIINTENEMVYVGFTSFVGLSIRWSQHKRAARRYPHRPLYRAMNEIGIDKFSIHIIERCQPDEEILTREQYWIDRLNSLYPNGYNAANAWNAFIHEPGRNTNGDTTKEAKADTV